MSDRFRVLLSRPLPGEIEQQLARDFEVEVLEEGAANDPAVWHAALRDKHPNVFVDTVVSIPQVRAPACARVVCLSRPCAQHRGRSL